MSVFFILYGWICSGQTLHVYNITMSVSQEFRHSLNGSFAKVLQGCHQGVGQSAFLYGAQGPLSNSCVCRQTLVSFSYKTEVPIFLLLAEAALSNLSPASGPCFIISQHSILVLLGQQETPLTSRPSFKWITLLSDRNWPRSGLPQTGQQHVGSSLCVGKIPQHESRRF